ncbi:glycosyltransferase family 2 protein [Bizionia arctica]|uniref:Glycosyltransferase 2-like domain-containing protein n=1 Tax=Bizionia arctica TaxID=1495645 RepID=A0A917LSK2_9FLAO|nr:glycosyltransferase [Bizionia arctica]GGG53189.1 hypothetical protein GCM10010976_25280 [Bizionia arctica]
MKLSVRLQCYNHALFLEQALKGIIDQKTNFPFEVVIGDDFSTDNSLEVIEKIIKENTNTNISFNLLKREKGDSYSIEREKNGRLQNFVDIINHCQGKYIALLDGDDYWTDPLKLQKQVDFLEANEDFHICFHRANLLKNESPLELHPIPGISNIGEYLFKDILENYNFILTASVVFRKPANFIIPKWFMELPFGDLGLYQLVSNNKKIKCLDDIMSVYRMHSNGLWTGLSKIKIENNFLNFYQIILPHLTLEEKEIVKIKKKTVLFNIAKLKFPKMPGLQKVYYFYLSKKTNLNSV